jgi:DNA polymerase-3 subunit epsilon
MKLNLKNPAIVFDLETTGLNISTDRIVEIATIKIFPDGQEESKTRRINPGIPIPPEVSALHGICDDDVKDCPDFKSIARSFAAYIEGCDLIGYNLFKFDVPLLAEEFLRAGVNVDLHKRRIIDVQNIFHKMEQRTLAAAYKFYCGQPLHDAHSAESDTRATYEVLQSQLDHYDNLQNDTKFLSDFSIDSRFLDYACRLVLDADGDPSFNFGKHKGRKVTEVLTVEPSYYSWMMNGDFPMDTKRILTEIRLKMRDS